MRGAQGRPHHRAGIGVDAAGDVQRQLGSGQPIDAGDELGVAAFERAGEAYAEQAIHHQVGPQRCRWRRIRVAAACAPFPERDQRVFGQLVFVPGEYQFDAVEPALELCRHLEGIAAVVARTGQYQDVPAVLAEQLARVFGGGEAGLFHQRRALGPRVSESFDLANFAGEVDWPGRDNRHLLSRTSGNQVAICGKMVIRTIEITIMKKNGIDALAT